MFGAIASPAIGPAPEVRAPASAAMPIAARAFGSLPPTTLLLLAIVFVQLGSALATSLLSSIGPIGTTFAVAFGAAVVLTLWVRPRPDRRLLAHWRLILLFGLVNVLLALPYFLALGRIPLGVLATVTFLGPLGIAVAMSRRLMHFALIGIAGLGVALLTPQIGASGGAGLDPLGLVYAALAALGWGAFVPMSKRMGEVFSGLEGLVYAYWLETFLVLPAALLEGSGAGTIAGTTPVDLLSVIGVALLSTALPNALEYRALQRMSARTYGILVTLEPAAGAMVGIVCLDQPVSFRMTIAVACVTLAALGITLSDRRDSSDG
jgi:inner membrane transporter RhtA